MLDYTSPKKPTLSMRNKTGWHKVQEPALLGHWLVRNKVDDATTKIHISLDDPGVGDHEFWIWKLHVLVQENTNWVSDPQGEIPPDIWAQYVAPEQQQTPTTEGIMPQYNDSTDRTQWHRTVELTQPLLEELLLCYKDTEVRYCFTGVMDKGYPLDGDITEGCWIYLKDPDHEIHSELWDKIIDPCGTGPEPEPDTEPESIIPEPVAWRPRHLLSLPDTGLNIFVDLGPQWAWVFEDTELSRTVMDEYIHGYSFTQEVMIPLYTQALSTCGVSVELEAPITVRSAHYTSEPCGVVMNGASLMDTYAESVGLPDTPTAHSSFTEIVDLYDDLSPSQQTTLRGLLNNR